MILKGRFIRLVCDLENSNDYNCSRDTLTNNQDYVGITYKKCFENAKKAGWKIKDGKVFCPYHAKKLQ